MTWVGIDGYYLKPAWRFAPLFGPTIGAVRALTGDPIIIAETGATPAAGQPAKIADLFAGIRAYGLLGFVWFDSTNNIGQEFGVDSPAAIAAFRQGASAYHRPGHDLFPVPVLGRAANDPGRLEDKLMTTVDTAVVPRGRIRHRRDAGLAPTASPLLATIPVVAILVVQAFLAIRILHATSASGDEAIYIYSGHELIHELWHGGGSPTTKPGSQAHQSSTRSWPLWWIISAA